MVGRMPYTDPEAKKAWRRRNRVKNGEYTKRWQAENPDRVKAHKNNSRIKSLTPSKASRGFSKRPVEWYRRHRQKLRALAIKKLGEKCERCGFDDDRALEFDHREALFRNTNGIAKADAAVSAREILDLEDPHSVFALLCANCHRIKTRESGEWRHPSQYEPRDDNPTTDSQLDLLSGS